ncbi:MAG: hypothetical protein HN712_23125 [Gemmatimonadetes bacterium]|jgi:exosortase/archaeosortase family protein|nr:hypothetical protein [Gemmatimonadota bacterium]MBT6149352.1 hypothetical protein [Gemmatimonadota bacterium]MBT7863227.1 hypothetical protein [Gemmatimonadota bacterium]
MMTPALTALQGRAVVRFVASFVAWLAGFAIVFEFSRDAWVNLYMVPLTRLARLALVLFGLPARIVETEAATAFCLLQVEGIVYRVTFECTGIFALFLCMACILAFPTQRQIRFQGLALVIPAFLAYSVMRLIILGLVAHWSPQHIDLFHLYIMVVANVGFVLALWLYWLQSAVEARLP